MPQISVIDECYAELDKIKAELIEQKRAKRQPIRTTFSEVVCMLIKGRKGIA
jgi:predicted CopG family antitoxin